jgi:hypothetical protein
MNLWRIHLRTAVGDVSEFCRQHGVIGIGWPVDEPVPTEKDAYLTEYRKKYPQVKRKGALDWFIKQVKESGDLVWARAGMKYYLGKTGEWEPKAQGVFREQNIGSVRQFEWLEVGEDDCVPQAVVTNFIKGPAFRRIPDAHALEYSNYLYAKKIGRALERPEKGRVGILELIGPEDMEDIVAVYLQRIDRCIVFPSTCKKGTKEVECFGVSEVDYKRVGFQVKTGKSKISDMAFKEFDGRIYLFQMEKWPDSPAEPPCIRLSVEEIEKFVRDPQNRRVMPKVIQNWLDYAGVGN